VALAAFHTLFNFLGVILLLPVIRQFSRLVVRLVPERQGAMTRFLDHSVGEIGPIGVEAAQRTAREIAVSVFAVLGSRIGGKPDAGERATLEAAREAIGEVRRFLGRVRSTDVESDRTRHLGVLHALDHLEELTEAAQVGPTPALLAEVPGARDPVAEALRLTGVWLAEPGGPAPVSETAARAEQAAAELTFGRRLTLERTAAGEFDAEQADVRIGTLRWFDRVARHLARAVNYLG
jgi:phosphate:Na+ symporter